MSRNPATSPTHAKTGDGPGIDTTPTAPSPDVQADGNDASDNHASTLIEAPVKPGTDPRKRHDFPEGGGSGGAEAFRRAPRHVE